MQLGAFGAAPATAAVAWAAGDHALGGRLLAGGTAAWVVAKVVKRLVQRARPGDLVADCRVRGRPCSGDGFPSGHAGVATALAAAALVSVDPELTPLLVALAATVGTAWIYVGAHLPLDVVGGVAIGLVVDGTLRLLRPPRRSAG